MPPKPRDLKERLLERVVYDRDGCWLWTGLKNEAGYGKLGRRRNGRRVTDYAHRVSHEVFKGPIGDGLMIDHLCRVHACVNPDHLEAVTPRENVHRGLSAPRTTCSYGHSMTAENLRVLPSGRRHCRKCQARRSRELRRRRTEERIRVFGRARVNQNTLKTACVRGHPFTPENTRITPRGARACRACVRLYPSYARRTAS